MPGVLVVKFKSFMGVRLSPSHFWALLKCYKNNAMFIKVVFFLCLGGVVFGCADSEDNCESGDTCLDGDNGNGAGGNNDGDDNNRDLTPALDIKVDMVATGLNNPVFLTSPPNDQRLFVLERPGRIRVVEGGVLWGESFLDITGLVTNQSGEQGLLGLAFHPEYEINRRFFVNYTASSPSGATVVAEYRVDENTPNLALLEEKRLLVISQPFRNHNGGMIAFGPDGYLYIGMGDGGSGGDPLGHGQNPQTLLGALLRIDVDQGANVGIPSDNPFVGNPEGEDAIWATGLRNPWRFSFDKTSGDLFVGDVGQSGSEEINRISSGVTGHNLGWAIKEGSECFRDDPCGDVEFVDPIFEYSGGNTCSVIGGYVYNGESIEALQGQYMYADFCSDEVFLLNENTDGNVENIDITEMINSGAAITQVSSFGEDASGELYILSLMGNVYKVVEATSSD